jgi:hypothetical protein
MPLGSAATYPGGTYRTDVNTSGYEGGGGPGGGGGLEGALWQMAQRRAEQAMRKAALEERRMALENKAIEDQMREARRNRYGPRPREGGPRLTGNEVNARQAEVAAAEEEARTRAQTAREMRGTGPRSYIKGLGYIGGPDQFTPNYSKMTGIQRSIFMPKSAGFDGGGPSRMETEGAASDSIWSEIAGRRAMGLPSAGQEYFNRTVGKG